MQIDNAGYVLEAARKTPVAAATDVLIVGGGPAGIAAAVAAARAGSRVLLAERYGYFGGMATAALVGPLMSYHTTPTDGSKPEPVIAGVLKELVRRMVAVGGAVPPGPDWDYMTLIDAPALLAVSDASTLAALVDGAILVVESAHTHKESIEAARKQLEDAKVRVLGVVVNRAQNNPDSTYYLRTKYRR